MKKKILKMKSDEKNEKIPSNKQELLVRESDQLKEDIESLCDTDSKVL